MEFYKKMMIGGGFTVTEGQTISFAVADGNVNFAEVIMIAALPGALVTIAYVFLRNNMALKFRIRDGELNGTPSLGSTRRRAKGRRYTTRR